MTIAATTDWHGIVPDPHHAGEGRAAPKNARKEANSP
jgi:hypothetical protein